MELEYQVELMHALDSQNAERELAISLLEYGRLIAAAGLSRIKKDNLISEIGSLAAEIEQDEKRLEYFNWVYIVTLLKGHMTQVATAGVRELCEARFPFLYDYLTVRMDEVQEKPNELRARSSETSRRSDTF